MKNAILQIKKLYGTGKKSLSELKQVHFVENQILWTDFDFYYKKELETDVLNGFSADLKNLYNTVKTIKNIDAVKVENDILILNNNYKIKLEKTEEEFIKNFEVFKNDLKNQNIVNDFVIADYKEFIKGAEDKSFMSLLHKFVIKPDELACTDGNRLNIYKIKTNVNDKNGVLVPADFITKNLNKKSNFYLSKNKDYISCVSDDEIITCKYSGGQYPKYEQLIPENETVVKYDNKDLLQILKNIKPLVNKRAYCIKFNFNENFIEYETEDLNINKMPFNFNMPENTGFGVIGFNLLYLIDLLNYHHGDGLVFEYGVSELRPVVATSRDKLSILMPIQIRDMAHVDFQPKTTATPETIEIVETVETPENIEKSEAKKMVINKNFEIEETGIKSVLNKIKNKVKTVVKTVVKQNYTPLYTHKNAVTGHVYGGFNVMELDRVMTQCGYEMPLWVGNYQAKKLNKQVKSGAEAVTIRIFYENDDGTKFSKLETVYNVAELEPLQKTEEKEEYKSVVNRLKKRA